MLPVVNGCQEIHSWQPVMLGGKAFDYYRTILILLFWVGDMVATPVLPIAVDVAALLLPERHER